MGDLNEKSQDMSRKRKEPPPDPAAVSMTTDWKDCEA